MAITVLDGVQRDQTKTISVQFKNSLGTLTDPTTVTFDFETPAGSPTTYTYPTDNQLVKDSTGAYHVNLTLTSAGRWAGRFKGVGVVNQAAYFYIYVGSDVLA